MAIGVISKRNPSQVTFAALYCLSALLVALLTPFLVNVLALLLFFTLFFAAIIALFLVIAIQVGLFSLINTRLEVFAPQNGRGFKSHLQQSVFVYLMLVLAPFVLDGINAASMFLAVMVTCVVGIFVNMFYNLKKPAEPSNRALS